MIRAKENYPQKEKVKGSRKGKKSDYSRGNQTIIRELVHQDYCQR
jgi:hypothetical protein